MITLITTHAESMFDPAGIEPRFEEMRKRVCLTARAILKVPRTSDYRVLLISRSGKEVTLDSVPDGDENPLIVSVRPPAVDLTDDSWVMAVAATANVVNMIESICGRGQRREILPSLTMPMPRFFLAWNWELSHAHWTGTKNS